MTQLTEFVEEIREQLVGIPGIVQSSRVKIAKMAGTADEFIAGGAGTIAGLQNGVYDLVAEYASQRALLIENDTSRLDLYNIAGSAEWQSFPNGFTFPTATSWIGFARLDNGTAVSMKDGYYLIEKAPGEPAARFDLTITLKDPSTWTKIPFTVNDVTAGGVVHEQLIFDGPLAETPAIGTQYAIFDLNDVQAGTIEVGIEGLGVNPAWDPEEPINPDNDAQFNQWFADIMLVSESDFVALVGDKVANPGSDDVYKSADSSIRSVNSPPYTQARLEKSPFYPALNDNENTWPEDTDAPDVINRKQAGDWAVYPRWRWQGRLIPAQDSNVYSEDLPAVPWANSTRDSFLNILVSSNGFPVNSSSTDSSTDYYWDAATDLIYEVVTTTNAEGMTTTSDPVRIECTYNSMSDKIKDWNAGFGPMLAAVRSRMSGFTNSYDSTQALVDTTFKDLLDGLDLDYSTFFAHHDSWFSAADDGVTSVFNELIGTYDQTAYNALASRFANNTAAFTDRISNIESVIGSAENRTGYAGEVLAAVDVVVNRNFGFLQELLSNISRLNSIKNSIRRIKRKFNAYS